MNGIRFRLYANNITSLIMHKRNYIEGFKWLAIYQIVGGLIGLYSLISPVGEAILHGDTVNITGLIGMILFSYSIFCGITLWQRKSHSLIHTLVNQYLQLVQIVRSGFAFGYVAGFSMTLNLEISESFFPWLKIDFAQFFFNIGSETDTRMVGINIISLLLLLLIHHELKSIWKERIRDEIDSIGKPQ